LHTRSFYDHNPLNKMDDSSFLFYKKKRIIAVMPCNIYNTNSNGLILNSFLRATYGGFVVNNQVGTEEALEIIDITIKTAKDLGINEIIVRNPFRIFQNALCDETDYAMWFHNFKIKYRELETVVALDTKSAPSLLYHESTARSVKKARKTVQIGLSNEFEAFWTVLTGNLMNKYGLKPTHSLIEINALMHCVGEDKVKLFVAKCGEEIAAGIVLFILNNKAIQAQYIGSSDKFQEHRPLNAVIDEIIFWGRNNGFSYLNLGTSNSNQGKDVNLGLFRFKEGFGGRNILRETMHLLINE
jgi:hypothetical protein